MTPNDILRHRLAIAVDDAQDRAQQEPWVWGNWDCAMACATVVAGPLGYDPAARWRERYTSWRGFRRVLRNDGLESLTGAMELVARERGWQAIDPVEARRGDVGIAIADDARMQSCLLAFTADWWLGFRPFGYGMVARSRVTSAWRLC